MNSKTNPTVNTSQRTWEPKVPTPMERRLRVFAFDPLLSTQMDTYRLNETLLGIRWEPLQPGPVGEYLEVVDVDPGSNSVYAPVDLHQPSLLAQSGYTPSEANPQFHQQMVYAVAMKTIGHFERALGRVALWAPNLVKEKNGFKEYYVQRLRIYPHALREANAYYSPDKKSLLFGYFEGTDSPCSNSAPPGLVFCCLSHDVVAHETTHALLDGLHRRYRETTNSDMLAFHEAFADIVALFQHFTMPEALKAQIARTQGDLSRQNLLGELAQQFGQAIGLYGALRSAIGKMEKDRDGNEVWMPIKPRPTDYQSSSEPHARGAILVSAVFATFLAVYKRRSADLIRLATYGTGVLPPGAISYDLVNRLAQEAAKTATHILNICIRALDYCPPVNLNFGDYARALITADHDLVPDDPWGYRIAFIEAFRARGIVPRNLRSMSVESMCWEPPDTAVNLGKLLEHLSLHWDLHATRRAAFEVSRHNGLLMHQGLNDSSLLSDAKAETLGFYRSRTMLNVNGQSGTLSPFEVHSVRPVRRIGPDGQQVTELLLEITQTWTPHNSPSDHFRGGSTLLIDLESGQIRYCVRKRPGHPDDVATQQTYQMQFTYASLRANYFGLQAGREPFAMLHRGF
jgi:hypothetical protein